MEIASLDWHDHNEAKLLEHGVGPWEVNALVSTGAYAVAAHPDYPDQVRIFGPTTTGRFVTVVLEETANPTVWRPITGWPSTAAELAYYRQTHR